MPGRALLFVLLVSLLTFELGSGLAIEAGLLPAPPPAWRGQGYWWGGHPELGVWRHPDARYSHRSACFHVDYRSNSAGARDRERERSSTEPRVLVLGDSFLAGWGLREAERLSNRLENATGLEHPNFAMAHFSPYQALLAYRELARYWEHDGLILGLLPVNDFVDGDLELARRLPDYEHRYRPYLVEGQTQGETGGEPGWQRLDYRENPLRRLLRRSSYGMNALLLGQRVGGALWSGPAGPTPQLAPGESPSWFYDYREADAARVEAVLAELAEAAEGRPLALLLIPAIEDLRRFARSGPAPLAKRLAPAAERLGIQLVDLLPRLAREPRPRSRLFFDCDYHWNAAGNRAALAAALEALEPDFYARVRSRASRRYP